MRPDHRPTSPRRRAPAHRRAAARAAARAAVAAALGAATLAACGSDPSTGPTGNPVTSGTAQPVPEASRVVGVEVARLDDPVALLPRPGDDRLWAAERTGQVRTVEVGADGALTPSAEPQVDLGDETTASGEQGLLGLAFAADGAVAYVSYTNLDGDSRVEAFDVVDGEVDAGSRREVFATEQPYPNHNGGHLLTGPDGTLYLGLGDGGSADDPENRAQDDGTPLGKLLALDPAGGEPRVVAKGLRNPWRFDIDVDGSFWIADVGQNAWEEINRVPAAQIEGANLGWSGYEGTHEHLGGDRRPDESIVPIHEYDHGDGRCSITGGFVYRGSALPALAGAFLYADWCEGRIRAVRPAADGTGSDADAQATAEPGEVTVLDLDLTVANPQSFGRDADGEPYVLSATGAVVALRPAG